MKNRNGEIDIFRFVFAIVILAGHWCSIYTYNLGISWIGVEFFFLVSGYLMSKNAKKICSTDNKETVWGISWKFILKKIDGFFLYYIAAFIIQILVRNIIIRKQSFIRLIFDLLKSIPTLTFAFLPLNTETPLYIGGSWYLSAMITAMIILYPLLVKWYDMCTKYIFPLLAVFSLGYLYGNYGSICSWNTWNGFCYLGIIRAISEIAIGASLVPLSEFLEKKIRVLGIHKSAAILLTLFKYGSISIVLISCIHDFGLNDIYLLIYIIIFVLLSFSNAGYQIKDSSISRALGKMSLAIYIFHPVMLYAAEEYLQDNKVSMLWYFICVIGSVFVSIILMFVLDKIKEYFGKTFKRLFSE